MICVNEAEKLVEEYKRAAEKVSFFFSECGLILYRHAEAFFFEKNKKLSAMESGLLREFANNCTNLLLQFVVLQQYLLCCKSKLKCNTL